MASLSVFAFSSDDEENFLEGFPRRDVWHHEEVVQNWDEPLPNSITKEHLYFQQLIRKRKCQEISPQSLRSATWESLSFIGSLEHRRTLDGHTGCVNSVNWCENGDRLVSAGDDRRIIITSYNEFEIKHTFLSGHTSNIFHVKFVPGKPEWVVSCSGDNQIRLFDVQQEKMLMTYEGHRDRVKKFVIPPASSHSCCCLYSCSDDGTVKLIDLRAKLKAAALPASNRRLTSTMHVMDVADIPIDPTRRNLFLSDPSVTFGHRDRGRPRLLYFRPMQSRISGGGPDTVAIFKSRDLPGSESRPEGISSIAMCSSKPELLVIGGDLPSIWLLDRRLLGTPSTASRSHFTTIPVAEFRPPNRKNCLQTTGVSISFDGNRVIGSWKDERIYQFDVSKGLELCANGHSCLESELSKSAFELRTTPSSSFRKGSSKKHQDSRLTLGRSTVKRKRTNSLGNRMCRSEEKIRNSKRLRGSAEGLPDVPLENVDDSQSLDRNDKISQAATRLISFIPNIHTSRRRRTLLDLYSHLVENGGRDIPEAPISPHSPPLRPLETSDDQLIDHTMQLLAESESLHHSHFYNGSDQAPADEHFSLTPRIDTLSSEFKNSSLSCPIRLKQPVAAFSDSENHSSVSSQESDNPIQHDISLKKYNRRRRAFSKSSSEMSNDDKESKDISYFENNVQQQEPFLLSTNFKGNQYPGRFRMRKAPYRLSCNSAKIKRSLPARMNMKRALRGRNETSIVENDTHINNESMLEVTYEDYDSDICEQEEGSDSSADYQVKGTKIFGNKGFDVLSSSSSTSSTESDDNLSNEVTSDDASLEWSILDRIRRRLRGARYRRKCLVSKSIETPFTHRFKGHCNSRTIKDVQYLGPKSEWVASGSDDGRFFIWNARTSKIIFIGHNADTHVVNAIAGHPLDPVVATSGIDSNVKIWKPGRQISFVDRTTESFKSIVQANERRRRTTPQSFQTRHALLFFQLLEAARGHLDFHADSVDDSGSDTPAGLPAEAVENAVTRNAPRRDDE